MILTSNLLLLHTNQKKPMRPTINKIAVAMLVVTFMQATTVAQSKTQKNSKLTYQKVLDKYYAALGGKEKLKKVNNKLMKFSSKISTEVSGKTTKMTTKNIMAVNKDGKYLMLTGDEKDLLTKIYFDGEKGYTYLKALNSKTNFDDNLNKIYKNLSSSMLNGLEAESIQYLPKVTLDSLKGKQYNVIESFTEANNQIIKSKMYFDTKTGLLYATFGTGAGTKTESFHLDYKNINGFLTSMNTIVVSDLGNGMKSIISTVYEEYNYNGFLDSYFTEDISVSSQQLNSITVSNERHQKGLATLGLTSGTVPDKIDNISITNKPVVVGNSLRDIAYKEILESKKNDSTQLVSNNTNTIKSVGVKTKVKDLQDDYNSFEDLKYRRSSLYTMMINDPGRERNNIIRNAFGNTELSTKFNDHNIGPYLISGKEAEKDQVPRIEAYLNENNVAKELIAKWFNRDSNGNFNMDLVAERGQYNASDLNVQIAKNSKRGAAILKDAGEELIGNTFVIVYDYKYTNKEKTAKKRGGFLKAISSIASIAGADDVSLITDGVKLASDVVGKGYFVRTTSYLYKLVWDDETANTFYTEMWVDKDNPDQSKKEAFEKSNLFKLKYVGSEISRTNLQSTIFTSKSNDQLIEIATTRAVDKNIGKLQRKFEEFRVKTPLLSGDPISAKIGTKEGLERGDKFEVLEQLVDEDGFTSYKRVGTITVDPRNIWDNAYLANEQEEAAEKKPEKKSNTKNMFSVFSSKKKDKKDKKNKKSKKEEEKVEKPNYTIFKGKKGKYASGMLIRQIN